MISYKSDFPLFTHNPQIAYLDSASTSQKPQFVIDRTSDYISHSNSNIHRGMYDIAVDSQDLYDQSKKKLASYLGVSASSIIYTASATMAYNMLVQSLWHSHILSAGDHVILSIAEHHANIVPRQMLAEHHGIVIDRVGLDVDYDIDLDHLARLIHDRTKIVSLTTCSNVIGKFIDLSRVRAIIGDRILIADISQTLPHQPYDLTQYGVDIAIATGHKMMAYTGIGYLICRDHILDCLQPVWGGGDMIVDVTQTGYELQSGTQSFEPGTPSIISAVSVGYACDYIASIGGYQAIESAESQRSVALNEIFARHTDHIHVLGGHTDRHIRSFTVDGWTPVRVAEYCADRQICVRFGGHCAHPLIRQLGYTQGGICRISSYLYQDDYDLQMIDQVFTELKHKM